LLRLQDLVILIDFFFDVFLEVQVFRQLSVLFYQLHVLAFELVVIVLGCELVNALFHGVDLKSQGCGLLRQRIDFRFFGL
jgi:hypothetical protein